VRGSIGTTTQALRVAAVKATVLATNKLRFMERSRNAAHAALEACAATHTRGKRGA
jgi:hypothetical protein